ADVVNGQNVGVIESACGPSLLLETLQARGIRGDAGRQNFNRHVTSDAGISRAIDLAHASGPEETDNLVRAEYSPDHGSGSAFSQGFSSYFECRRFQEVRGFGITFQQRFHFAAKRFIRAGFLKITVARGGFELASGVIKLLDLAPTVQSGSSFRLLSSR